MSKNSFEKYCFLKKKRNFKFSKFLFSFKTHICLIMGKSGIGRKYYRLNFIVKSVFDLINILNKQESIQERKLNYGDSKHRKLHRNTRVKTIIKNLKKHFKKLWHDNYDNVRF